jgi:LacI family transcriptional regulator
MATIKDVAKTAQVSITTVSHVINGTRHVSDKLRERVLCAMETLGYRPNAVAQSLRRGSTGTIGLILPDNANMFFAEIARIIEDLGFQNGYSVILCNTNDDPGKEFTYTRTLLEKQVDGMLFISAGNSGPSTRRILEEGVPMVVVDRELPDMETDQILVDNFAGGYIAGQYLTHLGHRRLACIGGPLRLTPSAQRIQGFTHALEEANLPFDPEYMVRGDFRFPSGEQAMDHLIEMGSRRPSAVFVCNDMMAFGAIRSAHKHQLQVPQDLSIIGFDDIPLAQAVSPGLTTIAQPIAQLAQKSIDLLLEKMNRRSAAAEPCETQRIMLAPHLIERDTCAPWR